MNIEWLAESGWRLLRMTGRSRHEAEMDEELRFHLQIRTEQLTAEIVGVDGNVRNDSAASSEQPEIYFPYRQQFPAGPEIGPVIVMQFAGDPMSFATAVQDAVDGSAASQRVLNRFVNFHEMLAMSASQEKFQATLFSFF